MSIWKPAILGAVLLAAGCQPVGAPLGEERLATKIADVMIGDNLVIQVVRQQVQGLMSQNAISQDQANQMVMAMDRQMTSDLPAIKKTLVGSLTKEFNIKELQFLLKLLTSSEGKAVVGKQDVVMQETMQQMGTLAQEATAKSLARLNSAWPTGGRPAPPQQPDMQGIPPEMLQQLQQQQQQMQQQQQLPN
jgi:hypothetical protein